MKPSQLTPILILTLAIGGTTIPARTHLPGPMDDSSKAARDIPPILVFKATSPIDLLGVGSAITADFELEHGPLVDPLGVEKAAASTPELTHGPLVDPLGFHPAR